MERTPDAIEPTVTNHRPETLITSTPPWSRARSDLAMPEPITVDDSEVGAS
jgi:hypothetical protein